MEDSIIDAVLHGGAKLGAWAKKAKICGVAVALYAHPAGEALDSEVVASQKYSCYTGHDMISVPELCC